MNFEYKTEIIRFSRCVVFPCFPFVTFCGKGRDEGWTKDLGFGGKKEEKKGEMNKMDF
jgi:hypothetical protein